MRYNKERSLTHKETIDAIWGFLSCALTNYPNMDERREFLFDLSIERDYFKFGWSYVDVVKTHKATEEVHGFPIEVITDEFGRVENYFEYPFKDLDKITKEILSTLEELDNLEIL